MLSISFLLPVLGHKSVNNVIQSIIDQHIEQFEILVLRNGMKNVYDNCILIKDECIGDKNNVNHILEVYIPEVGKGNALNIGIDKAIYDVICIIDADCTLLPGAIKKMTKHFNDDRIMVVGGRLQVESKHKSFLVKLQQFEYMRVFAGIRPLYAYLNAQCLISGAFGMFRKDYLLERGGYDVHTVGEDMELTLRLQENIMVRNCKSIAYEFDAVCLTRVPQTLWHLMRQRDRWQRGLMDSLIKHWKMIGNPAHKLLGVVVMPYQLIVELFGPIFIISFIFSSNFREKITEYWPISAIYIIYEVAITLYAAFLISYKDIKTLLKNTPQLLFWGIANIIMQIFLTIARIYGMLTFWWRRNKW